MLKMEKVKNKFMNQLWNRENADYSAMVEQIPFNGIFCHSDISELLDMAKPHCLNSVLKLGFFVTGVFDYLRQWLMLFKSCHLAPLCWERQHNLRLFDIYSTDLAHEPKSDHKALELTFLQRWRIQIWNIRLKW